MKFSVPPLPYDYEALEPFIDRETMQIHHDKHHQAYVDKINEVVSANPELDRYSIEELITNLSKLPEGVRTGVRNFGGGHVNHSIFWNFMNPQVTDAEEDFLSALKAEFTDIDNFKSQFSDKASKIFGSGWCWLTIRNKKLSIETTSNQDSPLEKGGIPILGIDVWEHAYYLKYQNRRQEYIEAWWNVVNWKQVSENFRSSKAK